MQYSLRMPAFLALKVTARLMGIMMAVLGLLAFGLNIVVGTTWIPVYVVWGALAVVGIVLIVRKPKEPKPNA